MQMRAYRTAKVSGADCRAGTRRKHKELCLSPTFHTEKNMSHKLIIATAFAAALTGVAYANNQAGNGRDDKVFRPDPIPSNATTVTTYYKQNVYDPSDSEIGEIVDVLVGNEGKIDAFIVSVGGFLGMDSKDVAIPFNAVRATNKNGTWYLTMNATKRRAEGGAWLQVR